MRLRTGLCAVTLVVASCVPPGVAGPGDDAERRRAAATAARIEENWPVAGSGPALDIVRRVGDALARAADGEPADWRFTLIRDRSLNAFAVGDGRIFVNEGAVTGSRDEAELAAILAHEMGHQLAGHFRDPPPASGSETRIGSVVHGFDLDREVEADRASLLLLRRAGYDPHAALSVARQAGRRRWGADDERRLEALRLLLETEPRGGRRDSEAFRRARAELVGTAPGNAAD